MEQQGQNPQDNQDQSNNEVDDKKNEVINPQDNANNIDQPAELTNNKEEEPVLTQGDNQNKSEDKTPVVPEVNTPDNTTEESNNVIPNQQQIQPNANQGQNNNIPINNSKPAIQQNNNKTIANKPLLSNKKIKMGDVKSRVLKNSSLKKDGSRKIEKLAVTNAGGYLQQQIQPNANQGQNNNIPINNSKPAIPQNNNKTVANKPLVGNKKIKMGDVQSRVLKNSSLKKDGSRRIERLAVINAGGYLKGSESSKAAFQEVAMWGSVKDIEQLKNNHFKSNPTKSEEKSFYEKLTKAREDYLKNDVLKERDVNDLKTKGLTEEESKEMMEGIYARQKSRKLK